MIRPFFYRETQPVSLVGAVVRVLPQNNNSAAIYWTKIKSSKNILAGRIAPMILVLVTDKGGQFLEVVLLEFGRQQRFPAGVNFDIHAANLAILRSSPSECIIFAGL